MSWKDKADLIQAEIKSEAITMEVAGERQLALVNERLDAEEGRLLAWASWSYRCNRCKAVAWYDLEVGVEGPDDWRADGTYIACAFGAGKCQSCGGAMTHSSHADVTFGSLQPLGTSFLPERGVVSMKSSSAFRVAREIVRVPMFVAQDGTVGYEQSHQAFLMPLVGSLRLIPESALR